MRTALVALFVLAAFNASAAVGLGAIEAKITIDPGQQPTLTLRAEGAKGRFDSSSTRIDRVPAGTYSVYAFAESKGYYFVRTNVQTIEVKAGAVARADLRYRTALRGSIRVTGALPAYQGLRQLRIDPVEKRTRTHTRASLASDGTFDAGGLDPGQYTVKLPLNTRTLEWPARIGNQVASLNVALELFTVEGQAIDAVTGRPIDGADIEVRGNGERFERKADVGYAGGIQIFELAAGRYTLTFTGKGHDSKRIEINVPRELQLGEVGLKPLERAIECPRQIETASEDEVAAIAEAVRFVSAEQRHWWTNPERMTGFDFETELLLISETHPVDFTVLDLGRIKTLRKTPLWRAFIKTAHKKKTIAGQMPRRIRIVCSVEAANPTALIRTWPKAANAIAASVPAIEGNEALVYVVQLYDGEGFVVYLQRADGAWKARYAVQVSPTGC